MKQLRFFTLALVYLGGLLGSVNQGYSRPCDELAYAQALSSFSVAVRNQHALVAELEEKALQFVDDWQDPTTGLWPDRAPNSRPSGAAHLEGVMSSIAGNGFIVAGLAGHARRNPEKRVEVERKIEKALAFIESSVEHHNGWLPHFVKMEGGSGHKRWDTRTEFSTIDTAFLVLGALVAKAEFPGSEIGRIADRLYARLDFKDMLTDGGALKDSMTLTHGWTPEHGYLKSRWDAYSELMPLLILGLGHPTSPLPDAVWSQWRRVGESMPNGHRIRKEDLGLFTHQFLYMFVRPSHLPEYSQLGREMTLMDRELARADANYRGQSGFGWGRSAGDTRDQGYFAYTIREPAPGMFNPAAVVASAMFAPEVVLPDVQSWIAGNLITLGAYGPPDGVRVDGWASPEVLAVNIGPQLIALQNLSAFRGGATRDTSVWFLAEGSEEIARGLARAERLEAGRK